MERSAFQNGVLNILFLECVSMSVHKHQQNPNTMTTTKRTIESVDTSPCKSRKVEVTPDFVTIVKERILDEESFEDMLAEHLDGMVDDFVEEHTKKEQETFMENLPTLIAQCFENLLLDEKHPLSNPYEGDMHDCIYNTYTESFDEYIDEVLDEFPEHKKELVAELVTQITPGICKLTKEMIDEAT